GVRIGRAFTACSTRAKRPIETRPSSSSAVIGSARLRGWAGSIIATPGARLLDLEGPSTWTCARPPPRTDGEEYRPPAHCSSFLSTLEERRGRRFSVSAEPFVTHRGGRCEP